ncbi:unnamed protein product [Euphydryas editha]|uniref:Uncharacterized protein n=1 Tax=Euphydryas editha TaxID=104508 RepID=A0AAU9V205_EUPED|nr:unnamed protein product [Euphydryas editha]
MWKVLVFCVLVGGGARGQSWLDNITDDLLEGTLRDMQTSVVNYSKPVINVTYIADFEFDMRAMGHLYNSTHTIIDFIANKQAYPEVDGRIRFKARVFAPVVVPCELPLILLTSYSAPETRRCPLFPPLLHGLTAHRLLRGAFHINISYTNK